MANIFITKTFKVAFLFIFLAELLSFSGYFYPLLNKAGFFVLVAAIFILSLRKLEYGIFVLLAELFIGSKGYLFFFEQGGLVLSLRMALWLVIMSVWSGQIITRWIKNKKIDFSFARGEFFSYFGALFVFILWGAINGILNHNAMNNLFFDLNGWLYFTLLLPVYSIFTDVKNNERKNLFIRDMMQISAAAIIWLSLKTFILLFIFSHNINGMFYDLYRWVRVSGIGEITQMQGGFYRIFIQSHIFVLVGFFLAWLFLAREVKEDKSGRKDFWVYFLAMAFFLATIVISLSRSFWVGMFIGFFLLVIFLIKDKLGLKKIFINLAALIGASALSFIILIFIVKFPYPNPLGGFNATELLSQRAMQISGEAGASSRWALLPELLKKIRQAPILGSGFGATVTYQTKDPRILETSLTGEYTTYAFEWGWLDVWLKLGLFGLAAYLILIVKIIIQGFRNNLDNDEAILNAGLVMGIMVICVVSFFSPYMNHPLGIGYLIIASAIIGSNRK